MMAGLFDFQVVHFHALNIYNMLLLFYTLHIEGERLSSGRIL